MKKSIFVTLLFLVVSVGVAMAQEQPYYGGSKGDFAVSFDVLTISSKYEVRGLYMISDRLMLDVAGKIDVYEDFSNYERVGSDGATTESTRISQLKNDSEMISVGVNYLLRPGERIQPFVGGNICVERSGSFSGVSNEGGVSQENSSDVWSYGLCAVFGVDYFITNRISVSGRISAGAFFEDRYEKASTQERHFQGLRLRTNTSTVLLNFYF